MPLLPAFWMGGIAYAAPGAEHRQHARLPAVTRRSTTSSTWSSATTSPTCRLARVRQAARRRHRREASTSTGSEGWAHHRGTSTASSSRPAPFEPTCSGCPRASPSTAPSRIDRRMPEDKAGASGRAVNGIERRVVDPETGEEVPPRRGRRAAAPRRRPDDRLLQGRPRRGVHRRRLLPDEGPRPHRRRRLPVLRRPHRRHDQDELGQRVAPRGRGRAERPARGRPGRSSPACPTPSSARSSPPPSCRRRRTTRPRTASGPRCATGSRASRSPADRVHHPRRRPEDLDRQGAALRAPEPRRAAHRARVSCEPTEESAWQNAQERPTAEEIVLYEKDPETKIATITLDRADDLNAMTDRCPAPVRRPRPPRQLRRRRQGARDPGQRPEPRQRRRSARAHGHHGRPRRRRSGMQHMLRIPEDADIQYPPKDAYRYGADNVQFYTDPDAGMRSLQELQEDQHPRGPGLLLRLALLPSGRRRHRPHRPTTRCSATPRSATPATPPGSGSGAR